MHRFCGTSTRVELLAASRRKRAAFTLVELLVVIGIIAILSPCSCPSLNAARRQSVSAKCLSNLRSIGQALNAYAVDNKGCWPVVQHYNNAVTPPFDVRWNMMLLRVPHLPGRRRQLHDLARARRQRVAIDRQFRAGIRGVQRYRDVLPGVGGVQGQRGSSVSSVQTGYGMQMMPLNSLTFPPAGMTHIALH